MTRTRHAALAVTCTALLALGACTGGATTDQQTAGTPTSDVATPQDDEAVTQEEGGHVAPNTESSPEAAQAYLECLTDEGVGAAIVDETQVVLVADPAAGSASSSEEVSQAEEKCHEQVPEYVEPDFDQR